MNGILVVDKPMDFTSFDVVAKLRGMTKTKKIGHSGTLDPMATGVLPVFFGNATKAIALLPDDDKEYEAVFRLGCSTDTQDSTGKVLTESDKPVSLAALEAALEQFRGAIQQMPPMYSAVRINGQRLYDLARQGKEVERETRPVTIYKLCLTGYDPLTRSGTVYVACSKGTYIRTLLHDVGAVLGTGGIMTGLRRVSACGFMLEEALTLEEVRLLTAGGLLEGRLLPPDRLFAAYPELRLNAVQSAKFRNGVVLDLRRLPGWNGADGRHRIYGEDGLFLGLAIPDSTDFSLHLEKMFAGA